MLSTSPEPDPDSTSATGSAPRALLILAIAVWVEVLALVIVGGFALFEMTRPDATIAADLFLAAFAWGMALLLFYAVRGLYAERRWARSPVMTWQLFQIVIAASWLTMAVHVGAFVLLALAVVIIWTLMSRAVVAVTAGESATPESD